MTQKWTPEPWDRCGIVKEHGRPEIVDENGYQIAVFVTIPDRNRAWVCVNACTGMSDPAAYMASLMSIRVTIDTPNEVCDGKVTDTIGNLIKRYGQECLDWIVEATP